MSRFYNCRPLFSTRPPSGDFSKSDFARFRVSLPCSLSGLGLAFFFPTCVAVFFASFFSAFNSPLFPADLKSRISSVIRGPLDGYLKVPFLFDVQYFINSICPRLHDFDFPARTPLSLLPIPKGMDVLFPASSPSPNPLNLLPFSQHNLTKSMEYCYYNDLWCNSSPQDRRVTEPGHRILSCWDKHSFTVLTAIPYNLLNQGFELSDQAVRIFVVNRLQLDLPSPPPFQVGGRNALCPTVGCVSSWTPVGIHFSSCPAGWCRRQECGPL